MTPVNDRSFGILIAYILPGFLLTAAWTDYIPVLGVWLASSGGEGPTVGGFLYSTIASVGIGLVLSTLRWAAIDHLHHWTGLVPPDWDRLQLQAHIDAYRTAIEFHYRYYQFYANSLVALFLLEAAHQGGFPSPFTDRLPRAARVFLLGLFFIASRDALAKYYGRSRALVSLRPLSERSSQMTNGGDPHENLASSGQEKPRPSADDAPRDSAQQDAPKK